MHEAIPTPVIIPVALAVTAQPNPVMRFLPWIDDTYGEAWKATVNDNAAPSTRAVAGHVGSKASYPAAAT
jgi:hypothetical protein